jgi:hypothetical protein
LEYLFSHVAEQRFPVVLVIAEQIRHAVNGHVGNETFHGRGRSLDHRERATLQLLDRLGLRSKLRPCEHLKLNGANRQLRQALRHIFHRDVNGVRWSEHVTELEHDLALAGCHPRCPDRGNQRRRREQTADEQTEREERGGFSIHSYLPNHPPSTTST